MKIARRNRISGLRPKGGAHSTTNLQCDTLNSMSDTENRDIDLDNHKLYMKMRLLRETEMLLKCQVCQHRISLPLVVCRKGHCICKKCNSTGAVCPICNKFLITDRFVILENLLVTLPRLCKYSNNGCREMIAGDSTHPNYCLQRPKKCQLGKDTLCTWTGKFRDWLEHAQDISHVDVTFRNATNNVMFVQYYEFQSNWESYNIFLQFKACCFVFFSYKSEEFLHLSVKYQGKNTQNTALEMEIPNYSMKVTFLKDSLRCFTVELDGNDIRLAMCEDVPLDLLEPLVNTHRELDLYIELLVPSQPNWPN